MKKIIMFLLISVVGYGVYFKTVLQPVSDELQKDLSIAGVGGDSGQDQGLIGSVIGKFLPKKKTSGGGKATSTSAHTAKVGLTTYQGGGFPENTGYMKAPSVEGSGVIIIDNNYLGANLLVEFRQNNQVLASAFVKNGDRFSAKKLPAGKINLVIRNLINTQTSTTRGFDTEKHVKVTPYSNGGDGGNAVMMYRAEAQRQ